MTVKPLKKILLVDDDKVTNLMHGRLIRRGGLAEEIDVATDGVAALEYLTDVGRDGTCPPEIILLDINMPRMNGFEFLQAYADLPTEFKAKQIVIMLSTSLFQADHERAAADPNVHSFAAKPVRTEDIAGFVKEYHALMLN